MRGILALSALGAIIVACSSSTDAPVQKCAGRTGTNRCDCDPHGASMDTSTTAPCSEASLGAPALCCATQGFVDDGDGPCSCAAFKCLGSGANCKCAAGLSGATVDSCTPTEATRECCVDPKGQTCNCLALAGTCAGKTVPACTPDVLARDCGAHFSAAFSNAVTSCRK